VKAANSIDESRELQKTYLPGNAAIVRIADAVRVKGGSGYGAGERERGVVESHRLSGLLSRIATTKRRAK
jgi:hypothetical protein